jgi:type I restriction enzyme S subunit
MAMYGANVGKLGRLDIDAATNQAVCAFFPKKRLDSGFLWHYLRGIRAELIHSSIGAAQPNISQTLIRNLEIPIPPLPEQQRIVTRLEG